MENKIKTCHQVINMIFTTFFTSYFGFNSISSLVTIELFASSPSIFYLSSTTFESSVFTLSTSTLFVFATSISTFSDSISLISIPFF